MPKRRAGSEVAAAATMDAVTAFSRAPVHRVSSRAIGYWGVRALLGWLVVGGVATAVLAGAAPGAGVVAAVAAGVGGVALLHVVVMPVWRYRVHRWETSPVGVYVQHGWVEQERRIAPMSRVQTVDSERGPLERLFGLTNVTVTTASAAGPVVIAGLDRHVAEVLTEQLTRATGPGDAT